MAVTPNQFQIGLPSCDFVNVWRPHTDNPANLSTPPDRFVESIHWDEPNIPKFLLQDETRKDEDVRSAQFFFQEPYELRVNNQFGFALAVNAPLDNSANDGYLFEYSIAWTAFFASLNVYERVCFGRSNVAAVLNEGQTADNAQITAPEYGLLPHSRVASAWASNSFGHFTSGGTQQADSTYHSVFVGVNFVNRGAANVMLNDFEFSGYLRVWNKDRSIYNPSV